MSTRRVIKQATLEILKAGMGWQDGEIALVRRGGRPNIDCGEWFVGIWAGTREWTMTTAIYPRMSIQLTLTRRFGNPLDRWDEALDKAEEGFDDRMDQIAEFLYARQNEIRARADEMLPAGRRGLVEAPRPLNDPEAADVGPQWFGATSGPYPADSLICGLQATLVYGGWTYMTPWNTADVAG